MEGSENWKGELLNNHLQHQSAHFLLITVTVIINHDSSSLYYKSDSACMECTQLQAVLPGILIPTYDNLNKPMGRSLPSNFLCLETNVVLMLWLLSSTMFSNSTLLCWLSLSSMSDVQQVYPWGQTRRCSPEENRDRAQRFYTHRCHRIQVVQKAELSLWSKPSCDFGILITEVIKVGQTVTNGEG